MLGNSNSLGDAWFDGIPWAVEDNLAFSALHDIYSTLAQFQAARQEVESRGEPSQQYTPEFIAEALRRLGTAGLPSKLEFSEPPANFPDAGSDTAWCVAQRDGRFYCYIDPGADEYTSATVQRAVRALKGESSSGRKSSGWLALGAAVAVVGAGAIGFTVGRKWRR